MIENQSKLPITSFLQKVELPKLISVPSLIRAYPLENFRKLISVGGTAIRETRVCTICT